MNVACRYCGTEIDLNEESPHVAVTIMNIGTTYYCNELHHLRHAANTLDGYGARYMIQVEALASGKG